MADLVIVAADVVPSTSATYKDGFSGDTITQGQLIYEDIADGKRWKRADANVSAAAASVLGIALNAASPDQPIKAQTGGDIDLGATLAVAAIYILSATPGGICPAADLATGMYTTIIGIAISASILRIFLKASGVAKP